MRLTAASAPFLGAMLADPAELARLLEVTLARGWPPGDNLGFMRSLLEALERDPTELGWGAWFYVLEETRVLVGDGGFKGKPDASGMVEIGYGVAAHYQNRGLASEAAEALIDWAFANGASAVSAKCDLDNLPSIRVLQKSGMTQVGLTGRLLNWRREKD